MKTMTPRALFGTALLSASMIAFPLSAQTVSSESSGTVDTSTTATVVKGNEAAPVLNIDRERFSYSKSGRRDPYESLMATGELRPLVTDLRLTSVAYGSSGGNSVAILRDITTQKQYRVRVGQTLGRLKVSAIRQKAVIFTIDEFGFSRQETLPLTSDSTKARTR